MKIKFDSNTVNYYKDLIKRCEGSTIGQDQINEMKAEYYVFKNDYFFLMGDNRNYSHDSRDFGFISKEYIVGKVFFKF